MAAAVLIELASQECVSQFIFSVSLVLRFLFLSPLGYRCGSVVSRVCFVSSPNRNDVSWSNFSWSLFFPSCPYPTVPRCFHRFRFFRYPEAYFKYSTNRPIRGCAEKVRPSSVEPRKLVQPHNSSSIAILCQTKVNAATLLL